MKLKHRDVLKLGLTSTAMGESTVGVKRLYAKYGLETDEIPDHIAVELAFLRFLADPMGPRRPRGLPHAIDSSEELDTQVSGTGGAKRRVRILQGRILPSKSDVEQQLEYRPH